MANGQYPIEIIMARSLMSNMTTAAFLVDQEGRLIFFNEAAGEMLGVHFEEVGPMEENEWGTQFEPLSPDGRRVPVQELPLSRAVSDGRPAYAALKIRSATGDTRDIEVSAFPIIGRAGQGGAMAIFWD